MSSDKTCFEKFFQHEDIVALLDRFVIYHVDAPGQVRVIIAYGDDKCNFPVL